MTIPPSALSERGWGRCSAAPLSGESVGWSVNEGLDGREGSQGGGRQMKTHVRERERDHV